MRSYRLQLVDDQEEGLVLKNGRFLLRRDQVDSGMKVFKDFYRTKGMERISQRLTHFAPKMGVTLRLCQGDGAAAPLGFMHNQRRS